MRTIRRVIYRIEDVFGSIGWLDDHNSVLRNTLIVVGVIGVIGFAIYADEVAAGSSGGQAQYAQAQQDE